MKKKIKVLSLTVACAFLIGTIAINVGQMDSNLNITGAVSCLDGNHVGYHYSKVDPTTEHNGTKEYWVCCKCHEHYLAEQDGAWTNATPTDAYLASLVAGDDRYLPSLKEVTWANQDITIGMDPNGTADTKVNAGVLEATGWWIRLLTNDFHIPTGATAITFAMKSSKEITDMSYVVRYSGKSATEGKKTIGTDFEEWTIPLAYNDVDLIELEFLVEGGTLTIDNVEFVVPVPSFTFDGDEVEVTGGTKTDNGVSVLADTGWNPSTTPQLSFKDLDVSKKTVIIVTALITGSIGDDFKVGLIGKDASGNPVYNGTLSNNVIINATSVKGILTVGNVGTFNINVSGFASINGFSFGSCGHTSTFELRNIVSKCSLPVDGVEVLVSGGELTADGIKVTVPNLWNPSATPQINIDPVAIPTANNTLMLKFKLEGNVSKTNGIRIAVHGLAADQSTVAYNGTISGDQISNTPKFTIRAGSHYLAVTLNNADITYLTGFSFAGSGYTPSISLSSVTSGEYEEPSIHVGDDLYYTSSYQGSVKVGADGALELSGAWWVHTNVNNIPVPNGASKLYLEVKGNQDLSGILTYIGDDTSGSMKWLCTDATASFNVTTGYTTIALDINTTGVEYITEMRFCVQDDGSGIYKVLSIKSLSFTDPSF